MVRLWWRRVGVEALPGYQSSYTGPVFGASSISALSGGKRGVPDVSFEANPNTGVSVFDSTADSGQSGWFTIGGTSVGAPNWAGILAAAAAAGSTALQGLSHIYSGGFSANLRDVASGTNGSCGTDCTAGTGYDLVTGLGSPVNTVAAVKLRRPVRFSSSATPASVTPAVTVA